MTRTGAIQPGGEHAGGTGIQREIKYEGRKQMGISRRRRFEMAGIAARRGAKLEQSVRGAK
jgi:hypothetical protein